MADEVEGRTIKAGSASAAADAEAAQGVRSKDFIDTFRAFAKDPAPGAPDANEKAEDQSADDAPAAEAAADDGGDAPPAQTDEPAISDDYDPEAFALGPDDETPDPKGDARTEGTGKTWDALASDEDRKRAFDEMVAENARLKAAPPETRKAAEPEGKRPSEIEPPRTENVREVAERLAKEDPNVRQFVVGLKETKAAYEVHAKTYNELTAKTAELAGQITDVTAVVRHYEKIFEKDPENFAAKEAIVTGRQQLLDLRTQATDAALRQEQAKNEGNRLSAEYHAGLREIHDLAKSDIDSRQAQETTQAAETEAVKAATTSWKQSVPKALAQLKIPKEKAADFNRRLLEAAHVHTDVRGDIPDLAAWMLGPAGQRIAKDVIAVHRAETGAYTATKRGDVERMQPKPKGDPIAKPTQADADARDGNRRASDIAHRQAADRLGRELSGARR